MLRKNIKHQQPALISAASELPEKQRTRLANSWAGTFYREFFCRINEDAFADLYADIPSRPNVPVNVLVGLEALKAGWGWSDAELYENYCFNLQVRYALGYDRLGDGDFEIRTLYYFRERLSRYHIEKSVNLLEKAFEQITDAQIVDLKVRTGMQRMDSTQIASNIMDASRLQLLVEGVQRLHRILHPEEQERLSPWFEPYLKDTAGHYAYRVKGQEATRAHLEKVGQAVYVLLGQLKSAYEKHEVYSVLNRLLTENFHFLTGTVRLKENQDLSATSLQSLDDLDATYRTKGSRHYKGYVANVTETCDPQNGLQLITKVQVAPNHTEDSHLLKEALPNLKKRTQLHTLITDGAYPSETSDEALRQHTVQLIQTGIRGNKPDPNRFNLTDFQIEQDENGNPTVVTCPHGHSARATRGTTSGWFARFPTEVCWSCPFHLNHRCRAKPQKRDPRYFIDFTLQEFRVAQRRKDYLAQKQGEHNLRAAVEATVRSLKHPFRAGKLPVRGRFRMTYVMITTAMLVNVRRIWNYRTKNMTKEVCQTAWLSSRLFSFCQKFVSQFFLTRRLPTVG